MDSSGFFTETVMLSLGSQVHFTLLTLKRFNFPFLPDFSGSNLQYKFTERQQVYYEAATKHQSQKQPVEERAHFRLQLIVHHEENSGMEAKAGTWDRDHGEVLPTGLLFMVSQFAAFFVHPRTMCPEVVPTVGWALVH